MINKLFLALKKIIISALLLYAYDSFNVFSVGIVPINFLTLLVVSFFGIPGLFLLVLFSFIL